MIQLPDNFGRFVGDMGSYNPPCVYSYDRRAVSGLSYRPDPKAPPHGDWDRSGDEPRWVQAHGSLVKDALNSWKGTRTDMLLHIEDEQRSAPLPPSGSGKKMRAQAAALLWELEHRSESSPALYRGSHEKPYGYESWTEDHGVAASWADKSHGKVWELPPGTRGLKVRDYLSHDPENEWIVYSR